MGIFDSHHDAPDKLRQEGEELKINFDRIDSASGTITWQIPPPANGCNADNQAYCGIVIVLNTVANSPSNWPKDGTVYTADPTADADLHAGDKINGALVVGAFYNDKTTTSLTVTGLQANTAYFVTGHIADCVHRYHKQGVSTYSLPHLYTEPQNDRCAYQELVLSEDVTSSTATGLGGSPEVYTINLQVNGVDYVVTINASDGQTYGELVDAINQAIKLLENPSQGPTAPNAGAYWYDSTNGKLFQWDGDSHNEIGVIKEATDPSSVSEGEYWLDTSTGKLYRRVAGVWTVQNPTDAGFDPADPPCDVFWAKLVNSPETVSQVYNWNGSVWCERTTFVQSNDPSCAPDLTCSSYWYDDATEMLFAWDEDTQEFIQTEAIAWPVDPQNPSVGTFWFDDTTNKLYQRGAGWNLVTVTVSETAPALPNNNDKWFVPSLQELFVFNSAVSPQWVPTDVLIWGEDPTEVGSCDLWWDTSPSPQTLYVWDVVNLEWVSVESFTIGGTSPALAQTITVGSVWVQTPGSGAPNDPLIFWEWDGSQFVQIESTSVAQTFTDPVAVSVGDIWYDNSADVYYERIAGPAWSEIDVIASADDPTMLPIGTFWFNTTTNTLNMWNGVSWVNIMFSSKSLFPANGTLWFNTSSGTLLEWDSSTLSWIVSTPIAVATLNDSKGCKPNGNIVFTTTLCGSSGSILVGETTIGQDLSTFVVTTFTLTGTLWDALTLTVEAKPNLTGVDGLTGIPSYDTLGVGTDGSADERRELADSIRHQLGYPTVTVELTKTQLNEAIQKALEALRQRSASAYRRVYFFMDTKAGLQKYLLTNERVGFNSIVNVMGVWRITSSFMSTVHAAGVFGQTMIQHLFHMGTFDLVSYHLVSDYIEQMEQLFATRVTYTWDEGSRELYLFQRLIRDERVLLDCVIERTEQELLTNRWTKPWIERWALAEAKMMLAEIRGKYATLPGAGGGVSLNASDLVASANEMFARCDQEIDDFIVNDVENLGIGSEFIIG